MKFIADFHIHSKHSRATSRKLDLEHLYIAAQMKGITVIGTGDFTHPLWWEELSTKLVPAEEGLFTLDSRIARSCDEQVPAACRGPVRFMLVTEISNIYKKDDRTRKNHNLVFMPDMASAQQFNQKLDEIGNIRSDGRPILGLDARNLLEIVLDTSDLAYLVPAHIWTPWFSLLGSKSGFDSLEACFDDLSEHIFAVETGLSSDPPMNWRVSGLDRFTLISNSDAHSPGKLGREANLLDVALGFTTIRSALESAHPDQLLGTVEFYPEEGKYHVDGHRKCQFRCLPGETHSLDGICPVCGKPLVLGVLYRVEQLADRHEGAKAPKARPYERLIPLEEVLAETFQTSAGTKRVQRSYGQLLEKHGSEFDILRCVAVEDLQQSGIPLLAEAIERMRNGRVIFDPGYDGEFGQVRIFDSNERRELIGQRSLFAIPECENKPAGCNAKVTRKTATTGADALTSNEEAQPPPAGGIGLNPEQQRIVDHTNGPIIIAAGPGTGKTRTITCRMAALMNERQVPASEILAVTFTNKAAREMSQRLTAMLAPGAAMPTIATFHGLCRKILKEREPSFTGTLADDEMRQAVMADVIDRVKRIYPEKMVSLGTAVDFVVEAKQQLLRPEADLSAICPEGEDLVQLQSIYRNYAMLMQLQEMIDFEDLILEAVDGLEKDPTWRRQLRSRFVHLFVDEFQDINHGQYRLIRLLAPEQANLCVIGDPDQAIYGFRGSDVRFFSKFSKDYPDSRRIGLTRNYRSTETILRGAYQTIASLHSHGDNVRDSSGNGPGMEAMEDAHRAVHSHLSGKETISILSSASARAEAVAIGMLIEQMVGGTGFHAIDFGKVGDHSGEHSFSDFAVLFRTTAQGRLIAEVLRQAGIPCQLASREVLAHKQVVVKMISLLRVMAGRGSYADLSQLTDLKAPGISRETLSGFKSWAYHKELPLERAMYIAVRMPIQELSATRQQRLVDYIRWIQTLRSDCTELSVSATIQRVLARTTLSNQISEDDLQIVLSGAELYDTDMEAFLDGQALQTDTDLYRPEAERVALMTMHAAKGLEFNVVFVTGCEQGLVPYCPPGGDPGDPDEERRLLFVAMTRAKEQLFLSWARKRTLYGKTEQRQRSCFLRDIESQLVEQLTPPGGRPVQRQLSLF